MAFQSVLKQARTNRTKPTTGIRINTAIIFCVPCFVWFVRLLLLLLFILLGLLFFSGLVLTLFKGSFTFLVASLVLPSELTATRVRFLLAGVISFTAERSKLVITVKAEFLLVVVHLNVSIVFDPSLVFQPGNKDGLVID